jgi:hypothetical protein
MLQARTQVGQVTIDHVPDESEINPEVFVDQLVAHPRDLPPWHLRVARPRQIGYALYGLPNDLDIAITASWVFASEKNVCSPSVV